MSALKKVLVGSVFAAALFLGISILNAHCQVPCGIYDDNTILATMAQDIDTIEKSMKQIIELQGDNKNMNHTVRWINNKDFHADKFSEAVTYYFMAQRIKPVAESEPNAAAREKYIAQLTTLHEMMVMAMQCKQTTDLENVAKLRKLLDKFEHLYKGDHKH